MIGTASGPQLQSTAGIAKPASSPKRQAILVLGMHRSGTSALAGVIGALGAAGPKTMPNPDRWNPRGYFESAPLFAALDELLASAGSGWDDWRRLDPRSLCSEAAEQHRQKIRSILLQEFGDEPLMFVKDGRICRLVPFMLSILVELNVGPVAILPVRNPLEVALSLQRRDKFPPVKSLLLWLRHVLDAEYHSRPLPRCFLRYEELLLDWRSCMDRAAEKTGIKWPRPAHGLDAEIGRFLALDLRHEKSSLEAIKDPSHVAPLVRGTYESLLEIAASGESKELRDRLDLVRAKFDEGCEIFGPAVAEAVPAYNRLVVERDKLATERDNVVSERDALAAAYNRLVSKQHMAGRLACFDNIYDDEAAIALAVSEGRHRQMAGGRWEEIGALQFEFLKRNGLSADDHLLDIGCGSLRGGVHFAEYLKPGHYWGIDSNEALLDAGYRIELAPLGLTDRVPRSNLLHDNEFAFERWGRMFNVAIAQSLFTHLPANRIRLCLYRLAQVMFPGGRLFATYFEAPEEHAVDQSYLHPNGVRSYGYKDPFHYRPSEMMAIAGDLPWQIIWSGDWQHPRDQKMMIFERAPYDQPVSRCSASRVER